VSLVAVACAVCSGASFDPVHRATIRDPDGDPVRCFSSSRSDSGHLAIVRCRSCGLLLSNPRDDDATLARVYAALVDDEYGAEDAGRRRTAKERLALIAAQRPARGPLLDVGCSTGIFLEVAAEAGFEVTGLEASAWAAVRARERCPRVRVLHGALDDALLPAGTFSVATLWDVIEHLPCPSEALSRVHRWLGADGILLLNLPNCESWVARAMGRRWVLLLREHLWYFSPATIERLLRQNGFGVVALRSNSVCFSLAAIANRIGARGGVGAALARRLGRIEAARALPLRFPIGEMTVIARKLAAPARP
jgi:SAM-dependent methyltransferase